MVTLNKVREELQVQIVKYLARARCFQHRGWHLMWITSKQFCSGLLHFRHSTTPWIELVLLITMHVGF